MGVPQHQGCPFCDPLFVALVIARGLARRDGYNPGDGPGRGGGTRGRRGGGTRGRGGRGRGGGRGKGGRGGGRRGRRGGSFSDDDYVDEETSAYVAKAKDKMSLGDFL